MIKYTCTDGNLIELNVHGTITREEIDGAWNRMKADLRPDGKLRILEIVGELQGIEPKALVDDLKLGMPMFDRVERLAMVSDHAWIEAFSKVGNLFASAEIRTFEPNELDAARAWIETPRQ